MGCHGSTGFFEAGARAVSAGLAAEVLLTKLENLIMCLFELLAGTPVADCFQAVPRMPDLEAV